MKKITVSTKEFKRGLEKVGYIKEPKSLEFLKGFFIKSENGKCSIYRTDIENTLIYTLQGTEVTENFEIRVKEYKTIVKAFKFMTGDFTDITVKEDRIILSDSKKTMEVDSDNELFDYPVIKDSLELKKINCNSLLDRLKEVDYAMSKDDTRPILKGVHFGKEDIVALDGYRLAISRNKELNIENKFNISDISVGIIEKLSKDYKKDDMDINIGYNQVEWITGAGEVKLVTKRLEGTMFNYDEIVRTDHKNTFNIERKDIQENLKYLVAFKIKGQRINPVRLKALDSNSLEWSVNNKSGLFKVNTEVENHKLEIKLAFEGDYMLDAVKNIKDDNFEMCFGGQFDPIVLNGENSIHLVLPVRVTEDF